MQLEAGACQGAGSQIGPKRQKPPRPEGQGGVRGTGMAKATTPRRPERIKSAEAALIVGVSSRKILELAAKGEIPGVAKIGKLWTFDEKELREWVQARVDETAAQHRRRSRFNGRAIYPPPRTGSRGSDPGEYERMMQQLRSLGRRS